MRVYKPQIREGITIPLNIPAAQNRSNNFSGFWISGNKFILFRAGNDKCFIVPGQNTPVNLNSPIFEGCAHSFDLPLYALLNGREDRPAFASFKAACRGVLLNIIARFK
jgi:hypothetical protein